MTPAKPTPRVTILGTGGTIASRVDYRTGAVKPAVSSEELAEILPELRELASIEPEVILNKYSEHITPSDWTTMAQITADKIESGVSGVVILHGTDTMGYTAAALSFALRELPVPVVVVGSQRSSDRPSSDAALNLISAVAAAARAPFAEVTVAMHENLSDDFVLLHRATRVRKNHTSRRDAFQTIDSTPLGRVKGGSELELLTDDYVGRDPARELRLRGRFNEKVALLKFYPSFDPSLIDFLVDKGYLGFVLEGSGLGHINDRSYRSLERASEKGVHVFVTSQCIWGRTNLRVYDTGRDLLRLGVVPLENMLAETALVKLMWALGNFEKGDEVVEAMKTNIAGEIVERSLGGPQRGFRD